VKKVLISIFLLSVFIFPIKAQLRFGAFNTASSDKIDYTNPKTYEIGGVTISGVNYLDESILIKLSGLNVGDKIEIPGDVITNAIKSLWKQKLFSDVKISITKIQGSIVFLEIELAERPRLSRFSFKGIRKSEIDDIREEIKLVKGKIVTEHLKTTTDNKINEYFIDKGFLNVTASVIEVKDTTLPNSVILKIDVDKGNRVKINDVTFSGNTEFEDKKLRRLMKDTKKRTWYNVLTASKLLEPAYEDDKKKIIAKYNTKGYRDARIVKDTIYAFDEKSININITIDEGNKYYFGNVNWAGNTKYTDEQLSRVLGVTKGDIFNQDVLDSRLFMNPNGTDISSLYLDDGYLFFQLTPTETMIEGDTINLEMRIYEGPQATVNRVTVSGNTRTNDHVILREIRTKPGQKFSRSDIIRTQRELSQLGYFDPEKLGVNPVPHPENGTVDIEYVVEEKPSDQVELSGGWGGHINRVVGTLGVTFNNFSAKNILKPSSWRPLPQGDGQRLSVRAQTTGSYFQSYNMSFTEPWFGGKKPNALSFSIYNTIQTNGQPKTSETRQGLNVTGTSLSLGKRLKFPDDFFTLHHTIRYQHYVLSNYNARTFIFNDGIANNLSYGVTLARNSVDQPIYPRSGANISLSAQATPPYSLFSDKDFSTLDDKEKYKWIELHKWKFDATWYTKLVGNLVLMTRAKYGYLGMYNKGIGLSPFERFELGGDGLSGFYLDGRDIIKLRGYEPGNLTAPDNQRLSPDGGAAIYNKYTFELRYPLSLNPSATVYLTAFLEGGNTFSDMRKFDPFDIKRTAGFGVRVFLPMFGILGVDWGYGFDNRSEKGTFQIVLGFEPN